MKKREIIIFLTISLAIATAVVVYLNDEIETEDFISVANNIINKSADIFSGRSATERSELVSRISASSKKTGTFANLSSLSTKSKLNFLDQLYNAKPPPEINGVATKDIINDISGLSATLSLLALDNNERVATRSLSVINHLAMATHSAKQPVDLSDVSQSTEIKSTLEYLITDSATDDDIKGLAINAHSWLYPPDSAIISEFEKLIVTGDINQGDTLSAIFDAFSKYKTLHDYDMPASTLNATRKLVEHPSDSVKSDALYQLSKNIGKPALPVLFDQLKTNESMSVVDRIIVDILFLDQSDETVRQLKEIAAKSPGSGKASLIESYTMPKSIDRFRKITESSNK
jgi:hypothetical protein